MRDVTSFGEEGGSSSGGKGIDFRCFSGGTIRTCWCIDSTQWEKERKEVQVEEIQPQGKDGQFS